MKSFFFGILGGIVSSIAYDFVKKSIENQSIANFIKRSYTDAAGNVISDFLYVGTAGIEFAGEQDATQLTGVVSRNLLASLRMAFPSYSFSLIPVNQSVTTL
jgi:hypothetical protein